MSVAGISTNYSSYDQYNTSALSPKQMEKQFESLGSALESGDMATAKSILTTMQQNTPSGAKPAGNNQISSDMEKLSSAINSGDQKSAQDAYNSIKSNISQMKQSADQSEMPPGQSRGGQGQVQGKSASSSGSSESSSISNKYYDKMDANKDGKVTYDEEMKYKLKHQNETDKDQHARAAANQATGTNKSVGTIIDTTV
jgi:hypothetical protein